MTRINVAIKPQELMDKHLIAEHREIKRIPNCIKSGRYNLKGMPELFTLGTGHVKFFYDKLEYLRLRYESIYRECVRRGFNVTYFGESFSALPEYLLNNYNETQRDREILIGRLIEKDNSYGALRNG
jgi:hypothetical protein